MKKLFLLMAAGLMGITATAQRPTYDAVLSSLKGKVVAGTSTSAVNYRDASAEKGTAENPFTVGEVIEGEASGSGVWFTGYIVGWANNNFSEAKCEFNADATMDTNLLLADSPDDPSFYTCIPVQLPKGDVRNALNLMTNPGNLGRRVDLKGNAEKYFSVNAIKSVTEYVWINSLADLSGLAANETLDVTLENAVVTYTINGLNFLQDDSCAVQFGCYDENLVLEIGDVLNGTATFTRELTMGGRLYSVENLDNVTITKGGAPEAYEVTELAELMSGDLANRLVKVSTANFSFTNDGDAIYLDGNEDAICFDYFSILPENYMFPENTKAITGIVNIPQGVMWSETAEESGLHIIIAPRSEADIEVAEVISLSEAFDKIGAYETGEVNLENAVVTFNSDITGMGFMQTDDCAVMFATDGATYPIGTVFNGTATVMNYGGLMLGLVDMSNVTATEGPAPQPVVITSVDQLNGTNMNRLISISSDVLPMVSDGDIVTFEGYDNLVCYDYLAAFPWPYEFPQHLTNITGILTVNAMAPMQADLDDDDMGVSADQVYILAPRGEFDLKAATVYDLGTLYNLYDGRTGLVDMDDAVVTFIDRNNGLGFLENEKGAIMFASMDDVLPAEGSILSGTATMLSYGFAYVFMDTNELTITEGPAPEPTVIESADELNGNMMNRLVSVSNSVIPMTGEGSFVAFAGFDNLFGYDYFGVLPEGYEFPTDIANLAGIFTTPIKAGYSDDDMGVGTGNYFIAPRSLSDITVATGIQSVESNDAAVEYFNLQGVRVSNPENGVYIMRQGNKVSKVVISE